MILISRAKNVDQILNVVGAMMERGPELEPVNLAAVHVRRIARINTGILLTARVSGLVFMIV